MSWRATVLTIFPEMLPGPLAFSVAGRALRAGLWDLETVDIRGFARDKHRSVDDSPFGGGPGMIMRPDVLDAAIAGADGTGALIHLSPRGQPLDQERVRAFAAMPGVTLICSRFEGIDERLLEARAVDEVSLGDFVLSGGELPALVLIEAVSRHLPGFLGKTESLEDKKGSYQVYTRPAVYETKIGGKKIKWTVPKALLSGDHKLIQQWRGGKSS